MRPPNSISNFSQLGQKLTRPSGILELMDDLGRALTIAPEMRMLGGGNPAAVPEMQALVRQRLAEMLTTGDTFDRLIANYDPPQGNPQFVRALAELLRRELGWAIGPEHIAITGGGQSAFFYLFNLLGGRQADGTQRKILLPLAPEYIGYADQGVEADLFVSCQPQIIWPQGPEQRVFKYVIDFAAVEAALQTEAIAAMAVSRPTNPSGNVISDAEVQRLADLAQQYGIPLILDNAYGAPFPNVMYVPAQPFWTPQTILTLSLSKLGLPGTRTGIVIAPPEIAKAISSWTAIVGLANGNLGQQLVLPWVESGQILKFGPKILRPYYAARNQAAQHWAREAFAAANVEWAMHASEGAFFHWLWLPRLRLSTREFYQHLKARAVIVVPGEYFFYGLKTDWPHRHECLRLNFSGPEPTVREGLQIIAAEARRWQKD